MRKRKNETGRGAVVTGASSGIGRAFAQLLARDGWELTVVARNGSRLRSLARELRAKHGTRVTVAVADLTKDAEIEKLERRLARNRRLELLVNNAGVGDFGAFQERDCDLQVSEIRVNVLAVVRLTHAALPGMI